MRGRAGERRAGWRLLWDTTLHNRSAVATGVVVGLIWTAGRVAIPTFTGRGVDQGIIRSDNGALLFWSLIIVAVGAASAVCSGLRRYLAFKVAYSVETELREAMFANLQRLDFRFHDRAQTGQLMARAATDLNQINSFVTMIPITIANVITVVAVAGVLLSIDVRLAIIALGCLPLINVAAKRFSTRLHPESLALQQDLSDLSAIVEETVTGIRAVKGFGAEPAQHLQMSRQTGVVFGRIMSLARIRGTFNPLLDVLPAIGLAGVLWYGGSLVLDQHLSIGQLVAFNVYVVMMVGPLRMMGMIIAQAQRAVASAQRVGEILDASPDVADPPHPAAIPAGGGEVRFERVRFGYGDAARAVLDDFSLTVAAGESVALVGATGSGKTTVARLVPRFYDVEAGAVTIDGADVRTLRLRDLRRLVAVVFEDTFLFSGSVGDNIAFAAPDASPERVISAARLAGAEEFVSALPEGYDTLIGERGMSLSGGQRQRLALARAILADPRILVLDDATSSVDPTKEHEIRDALGQVMRGRTTIVISHRPATIALAERVVLLDGGRIVAEGTHEQLSATHPRYQEVLAQGAAIDAARAELDHGAVT